MREMVLSSLFLLGAGLTYANQPDVNLKQNTPVYPVYRPFAAFTLGADFMRTGREQTLSLNPPFSNFYTANHSFKSSGSLGLTAGIAHRWTDKLSMQWGLSTYFNSVVATTGHVWQFALPEFDNFTYRYSIQSKRIMASSKLLTTVKNVLHPYIAAELGSAFNQASSYTETPLIYEAVPMAPFNSQAKTSLSWAVGAGLDVDITNSLRLGASYQFADLGRASLGTSPAQVTQQTLSLAHLYTNQLRFQLTAFI